MRELKGVSGECPKCNSMELEYDDREVSDGWITWGLECRDCGWVGTEVNQIVFMYYEEEDP